MVETGTPASLAAAAAWLTGRPVVVTPSDIRTILAVLLVMAAGLVVLVVAASMASRAA